VLVEKAMGSFESELAAFIIVFIHEFLRDHNLGVVLGEAGQLRIAPQQIRVPDVAFIAWDTFPDRRRPRDAVYSVAPDLAVEVLSEGNTKAEMDRKLHDYFNAGTRLVWYLDPTARQMRVYNSPEDVTIVDQSGTVTGGGVLPGFAMSLTELFERAERGAPE
jgi:Uma2 family endonuclease